MIWLLLFSLQLFHVIDTKELKLCNSLNEIKVQLLSFTSTYLFNYYNLMELYKKYKNDIFMLKNLIIINAVLCKITQDLELTCILNGNQRDCKNSLNSTIGRYSCKDNRRGFKEFKCNNGNWEIMNGDRMDCLIGTITCLFLSRLITPFLMLNSKAEVLMKNKLTLMYDNFNMNRLWSIKNRQQMDKKAAAKLTKIVIKITTKNQFCNVS